MHVIYVAAKLFHCMPARNMNKYMVHTLTVHQPTVKQQWTILTCTWAGVDVSRTVNKVPMILWSDPTRMVKSHLDNYSPQAVKKTKESKYGGIFLQEKKWAEAVTAFKILIQSQNKDLS